VNRTQHLKHTTLCTVESVWSLRQLVAGLLPHLQWRWHGIGVLQAYAFESSTGRELRIHVWSPHLILPGILLSGNAHNHRFAMRSTVLTGAILHTEWQVEPGSGFALYDFKHARAHQTREEQVELSRISGEVDVVKQAVIVLSGEAYTFERGAFHASEPIGDVVVTLVEKTGQMEERARVIAPVGLPPVAAFGHDGLSSNTRDGLLEQARQLLLNHG
jgi:hypothetical protein